MAPGGLCELHPTNPSWLWLSKARFQKFGAMQCLALCLPFLANFRMSGKSRAELNWVIHPSAGFHRIAVFDKTIFFTMKFSFFTALVLDQHQFITYQGEMGCNRNRTDQAYICLLYTSDAADDLLCVDLGGRRIIKKKKKTK